MPLIIIRITLFGFAYTSYYDLHSQVPRRVEGRFSFSVATTTTAVAASCIWRLIARHGPVKAPLFDRREMNNEETEKD